MCFHLEGFIRFLYGYYMILITKQMPVAVIGYHTIYTIEDAAIIYIPIEDKSARENNLDEQKYFIRHYLLFDSSCSYIQAR